MKMQMNMQTRPRSRQRGLSLLEALLTTALLLAMLGGVARLLSDARDSLHAARAAERLQSFQTAAAEYLLANREPILDAMTTGNDGGQWCRMDLLPDGSGGTPSFDTTRRTCRIDATLLKAKGLLPPGHPGTTVQGETLVAIFRRVVQGSQLTGHVEMLMLATYAGTAAHVPDDRRYLRSVAASERLGASGGWVPDRDRGTCRAVRASSTYEVCGPGWKLDLRDFLTPGEIASFRTLLPQ
jgi:type II secretory pathway pseudopilin PulG